MASLVYFAFSVAVLFLTRRLSRLSLMAACVLLLLPLVLTAPALFTDSVYGPLDLAFAGEPLASIGAQYGVRGVANPSISDVYTEFFPWNDALRRSLGRGEWPLWNPFELCGTPLAGAAQAAPYHPVTVAGLLVPLRNYFAFAAAMLFFTAAFCAFLLLRDLVESDVAALFGAAAWMLSTHMVFFAGTALAHAVAVTPLVLLGARRIVRRPGVASAALLCTALVLLVLAGHPESALHIVAYALTYTLFQLVASRPVQWKAFVASGVGAGVGALLLTAFFLLPHVEVIRQSEEYVHRALGYRHKVSTGAQMLHRLRANAMPFLEGAPGVEEIPHSPAVAHGWMATAYAGSLVLALAVAGLFAPRVRERWFFAGSVLFGLAAGVSAPGVTQVLQQLPGFDIAVNDRMIAFAVLGSAVLAAGAIDEWLRSRHRALWLAAILTASLLLLATVWAPQALPSDYIAVGALRAVLPLFIAAAALLFLPKRTAATTLIALLLLQRAGETSRMQPTLPGSAFYPPFPGVELMRANEPFRMTATGTLLAPALSTHYGLEDVRGFQAVTLARYDATYPLWCVRQPVWFNRVDELRSPFLSLMNVRFAIVGHGHPLPAGWIRRGEFDAYDIAENTRALPRALVPERVHLVDSADESLRGIASASDFAADAWIEAPGERKTVSNANGSVSVVRTGARTVLRARMDAPGWVVLSDAAWKGWSARADGKRVPLFVANHAFLGISVPAGEHEIEIVYRPQSFVVGSAISGVSALVLLLFGIRRRFRARP